MQTKYIIGIVAVLIVLSIIPVYFGKKVPGLTTQDVFNDLTSQEEINQGEQTNPHRGMDMGSNSNGQNTDPSGISVSASTTITEAPGSTPRLNATISNFAFTPSVITIKKGTVVTWTNSDGVPHTVTSSSGTFDSGLIASGKTYSFTFTTAGTYDYICAFHPSMRGKIIVTE